MSIGSGIAIAGIWASAAYAATIMPAGVIVFAFAFVATLFFTD